MQQPPEHGPRALHAVRPAPAAHRAGGQAAVTGQEAVSVLIVLGLLGAYGLVHVRVFGWRPCPRCGGAGRIYSAGAHRDCARCGATGRVRRLGAGKVE